MSLDEVLSCNDGTPGSSDLVTDSSLIDGDPMAVRTGKFSAKQMARYSVLIEKFDAYLATNWSKPLYNEECARDLGMSPRSLSTVVTAMRGMSIQRYIRLKRLSAVREALSSNQERQCIGRIAKAHGFRHLGDFAGEYRRLFGERPSETAFRKQRRSYADGASSD